MSVRVDQVAGHVLPESKSCAPPQFPIPHLVCISRRVMCPHYKAGVEPVPRQEALGGEHRVRIGVVISFSLSATSGFYALQAFDQSVAAFPKRVFLWIQRTPPSPFAVQPIKLVEGPLKTPP